MTFELFDLDSHLGIYYRSIYPIDLISKWLSYNKNVNDYFAKREFVFILKDDIHLRYLSFKNSYEFKNALSGKIPYKIDLGAVYNYPPRDRLKYTEFRAKERELVIDIDLTDYDGIRTCCSGTNVCAKCWRFIVIAVEVLEFLMKKSFGFKHLLWVFSGRRGIHCWIADERARQLSGYAREAISKHIRFVNFVNFN